jgi:hypothetical protein
LSSPFTAATNATVNATTTYTATITDADSAVITALVTITVNAITINAGADQSIACDATANLVATPGGVFVPSTYKWSNGVVTLNNSVQASGTYGITATNSFGCTSSDEVVVSFPGVAQTLAFTTSASNNIGCVNQPITFNNMSSDKSTGWSWLWKFGDSNNNQSAAESPTFTYTAAGTYGVSLSASTVSGGKTCNFAAVTDSVTISAVCTGISDPALKDKIAIYPNPTEGLFTVSFKDVDGNGVIGIYDIRGALVAEQQVAVANNSQKTFSLSDVAEGIYFVKIQLENGTHVEKLTLSR